MDKLSYYDFFAIFIPGTVSIMAFSFIQNDYTKESLNIFLNISLGSSILILILIYSLGEIVQSIGKIVEGVFWKAFGGKPTQWISIEKRNKFIHFIRTWKLNESQDILTGKELEIVRNWVKTHSGYNSLDENNFSICFSSIQNIAFQLDENKKWINIMLAKANMFRGFIVICLISLPFLFLNNTIENYKLNIWISIVFLILSCLRYRSFSKNYAKKLYASFLKNIEDQKNNSPSPRVAKGTFHA